MKVSDFIEEFRLSIGDSTCSISERSIIAWINTALRRLARSKGLDRLFRYQDTIELSPINADGSKAASWYLDTDMGTIINAESLNILSTDDCAPSMACLCYKPFNRFRQDHPFPEANDCPPEFYTLVQFGGKTKIIFDAPISGHYVVDIVYTAFHPRISSPDNEIRLSYGYADILIEGVKILQQEESADYATARALYEDWDFLVAEARELLSRQSDSFGPRYLRSSF